MSSGNPGGARMDPRKKIGSGPKESCSAAVRKPVTIETGCQNIPVLSVSPAAGDHTDLEALLPWPQWKVHRAASVASALAQLQHVRPMPLVVCERDLFQAAWQDLLMQTRLLPERPFFIVTSRSADDHLWAEALNLGAYDVLTKPFEIVELIRSLTLAWQHSQGRREIVENVATA